MCDAQIASKLCGAQTALISVIEATISGFDFGSMSIRTSSQASGVKTGWSFLAL